MNALPKIGWIGPLSARRFDDERARRVAAALGERAERAHPRPRRVPRGARPILGLLLVGFAGFALHALAAGGSLPTRAVGAQGGGVPSVESGDQEMQRMRSFVAGVVGVGVMTGATATTALAGGTVPPGWVEVANSETQFSGIQGQNGWRYRFDQGIGTTVQDMPYFVQGDAWGEVQPLWCTAPYFANAGSFCGLGRLYAGTNTPAACSSPQGGYRRPIREWTPSTSVAGRVVLSGSCFPGTNFSGLVELRVNGALVYSFVFSGAVEQPITCAVDSAQIASVQLLIDPYDGSCHFDNVALRLQILARACPGDVTTNGTVDGVDLAALLAAWGGGKSQFDCDIDNDGVVGGSDLAVVLAGWGACP